MYDKQRDKQQVSPIAYLSLSAGAQMSKLGVRIQLAQTSILAIRTGH